MDIAHGEMAEKQRGALIERRSRKGEDRDEQEVLWKASVARHNARRDEEMRAACASTTRGKPPV